jgi:hypothetical protein
MNKLKTAYFLLLFALSADAKTNGLCEAYPNIYKQDIEKRIQSGIPFELMSVVFSENEILEKRVIHVSYDLWDEIISIKTSNQRITKVPFDRGQSELCKHLEVDGNNPPQKKKYKLRLLLNPLWSNRVARLKISTYAELESKKFIDVNWDKIAEEMPSEKILLEMDLNSW